MKQKLLILGIILFGPIAIHAMEAPEVSQGKEKESAFELVGSTQDGIPIDEDTLFLLGQERSPLPPHLKEEVESWTSKPENLALLRALARRPQLSYEGFQDAIKNNQLLLEHAGIKQADPRSANYIFRPFADADFVFKIAGPRHKLFTLVSSTGTDPYVFINKTNARIKSGELSAQSGIFSHFDFSKINSGTQTHQTVSRMAHFLLAQEMIKRGHMTHVSAVPTHLWHIIGQGERAIDDNYVVVKPVYRDVIKVIDLEPVTKESVLKNWSQKTMQELYNTITHAAIWDVASNMMVKKDNLDEVILQDFEQPNNTDERHFFYKGAYRWKFFNDVIAGLNGISDLLKPYPQQFEMWMNIIRSDRDFLDAAKKEGQLGKLKFLSP